MLLERKRPAVLDVLKDRQSLVVFFGKFHVIQIIAKIVQQSVVNSAPVQSTANQDLSQYLQESNPSKVCPCV